MEILLLRNERFQLYSPKISDEFHATDSSRILDSKGWALHSRQRPGDLSTGGRRVTDGFLQVEDSEGMLGV